MLNILYLIVVFLFIIIIFSALVGAVQFFIDLHRSKQELQFFGSRKHFIEHLIEREKLKDNPENKEGDRNVS